MDFQNLLDQAAHIIATVFGTGHAPEAPGTMGTIAAIPLFMLMDPLERPLYLGLTALIFLAGTWAAQRYQTSIGKHDPGEVVIDEVAGFLVTMALAPAGWVWIAVGFFAFRFFDILKPPPVDWLEENLPGGWGVMADDIAAGVYAGAFVLLCEVMLT